MAKFEGSIIVRSSDGSVAGDYLFHVELDDTLNIDSNGEIISNIVPGSTVYIAVNHSTDIIIDSVVPTNGSIQFYQNSSRTFVEEGSLFSGRLADGADEYDFPVVPGSYSIEYLGRPGKVTSSVNSAGQVTLTGDISKTPFMAKITANYPVKIYKFTTPDVTLGKDESYPIGIVFYISKVN